MLSCQEALWEEFYMRTRLLSPGRLSFLALLVICGLVIGQFGGADEPNDLLDFVLAGMQSSAEAIERGQFAMVHANMHNTDAGWVQEADTRYEVVFQGECYRVLEHQRVPAEHVKEYGAEEWMSLYVLNEQELRQLGGPDQKEMAIMPAWDRRARLPRNEPRSSPIRRSKQRPSKVLTGRSCSW